MADKYDVIEKMIDVSSPATEQGWEAAGKLGIKHKINMFDLKDHLQSDGESPDETIDNLNTVIELINAMYLVAAKKIGEQ